MHIIGLDVGTTGCKAIVFTPEGKILGYAFHEYDVICTSPGMAEQDAEQVWALTRGVLHQAIVKSGVRDIKALSVSVQGDAIIPVDRQFKAIHPAILGMDYRSRRQALECEQKCGAFELFQETGMRSHPMNSVTKVLLLREMAPEVLAKSWKIVTYADFILGKLGAEPVIDHTMASRTMAFDLVSKQWSSRILQKLDLDESLFSKAVPSGTPIGTLKAELADEWGVPRDLLLVTGAHDQPCAALGSGVIEEKIGVSSTGTAEVFSTAFQTPALSRQMYESYYPCYLHAKQGMYFTFALNHVGGILLKWFRDQFAAPEIAEAAKRNCDPYQVMDERMTHDPSPVMVLPHLNGSGTPWCDMDAKGAIVGMTLATTRHDIAKAILEGLTFELLINLKTMKQCGIDIQEIVAAGGGAKSKLWLQLKADILNRPVRTLQCREAACLGSALLAGAAAGIYGSLDEAVRTTVRFDREFNPRPSAVSRYQDRFTVYETLYPLLRPLNLKL